MFDESLPALQYSTRRNPFGHPLFGLYYCYYYFPSWLDFHWCNAAKILLYFQVFPPFARRPHRIPFPPPIQLPGFLLLLHPRISLQTPIRITELVHPFTPVGWLSGGKYFNIFRTRNSTTPPDWNIYSDGLGVSAVAVASSLRDAARPMRTDISEEILWSQHAVRRRGVAIICFRIVCPPSVCAPVKSRVPFPRRLFRNYTHGPVSISCACTVFIFVFVFSSSLIVETGTLHFRAASQSHSKQPLQ